MDKKLNVKDLVNVGLFSVLAVIFTWCGGMIGFVPALMPAVPFAASLLAGPVNMLYTARIKKPGMVFLQSILISIAFMATGHGPWIVLSFAIFGILGELILKKGEYKSLKYSRLCYSVVGISTIGNFIPIMIARDTYLDNMIKQGMSSEYVAGFAKAMPQWIFIPSALLGAVGAYIGCTIGKKMLRKHFEKAGMI